MNKGKGPKRKIKIKSKKGNLKKINILSIQIT